MRYSQFQDKDRDQNGDNAIAKSLKPGLCHASIISEPTVNAKALV
jgi:hypothetical protein